MPYMSPEYKFASAIVRTAGQLTARLQKSLAGAKLTKTDQSPVTVADFAVQALVSQAMAGFFPDDILVAEEESAILRLPESAEVLRQVTDALADFIPKVTPENVCDWIDRGRGITGKRFWTLDPVDGTKGFVRGQQFAVALALIEDGKVRVGAMACPNLDTRAEVCAPGDGAVFAAERGQGAWAIPLNREEKPIVLKVSAHAELKGAVLVHSFEKSHNNLGRMQKIKDTFAFAPDTIGMDSQAKYAVLAAGKGDIFMRFPSLSNPDYQEKIWDQAPGAIILEEAGGKITDSEGRELDFSAGETLSRNRGILATNGLLHAAVLRAVKTTESL